METINKNIRNLSLDELQDFLIKNNEKPFRAKQVYEWLWVKSAKSFDEMTNISLQVRELLKKHFIIPALTVHSIKISSDKTIKTAFKLFDEQLVEGVLIPLADRMTACISSQAGCAMNCNFCATGQYGYKRSLSFDEIYDQVAWLNQLGMKHYAHHLTNIVFMGMGEPLMNYVNVIKSIEKITSENGLGISPKRITLSTVGIAYKIRKLGDDMVKFNLAISLHSANNNKRSSIVPINRKFSLSVLSEAILYFYSKTNSRLTYEYILFNDFNDSIQDAKELVEFCKITPCKINLIEYNQVQSLPFKKTSYDRLHKFAEYLENKNLVINIRKSRGADIQAACGQLAGEINQ